MQGLYTYHINSLRQHMRFALIYTNDMTIATSSTHNNT